VKLIHIGLSLRFNMSVIFTANYFFSGRQRPVDSETFLVTDFVNLKIKLAQSFRGVHKSRVYMRVFTGVSTHTCIKILCFLRKKLKKERGKSMPNKDRPT
jgi:hypothetical protein